MMGTYIKGKGALGIRRKNSMENVFFSTEHILY